MKRIPDVRNPLRQVRSSSSVHFRALSLLWRWTRAASAGSSEGRQLPPNSQIARLRCPRFVRRFSSAFGDIHIPVARECGGLADDVLEASDVAFGVARFLLAFTYQLAATLAGT